MGSSVGVRSERFAIRGWNVLVPPSLVFVGVGFRPLFGLLLLGAGRGATVLAGGTVFPRSPLLCCCCFHFEMLVAPPNCVLTPWGLILSQHGVSHLEVPPLLYNIFILMLSLQRTVPQSINGHARGKKKSTWQWLQHDRVASQQCFRCHDWVVHA